MLHIPSTVSIVCADKRSECAEYAAEELKRLLKKAGIETYDEGSVGFTIILDDTVPGLDGGAFRRCVSENELRLEASEGCGVVYAVYDLLEDMGFRFLDSDCEVIPEETLPIRRGVLEQKPAFRARELFWRDAMDGAFAVKLRLNSARSTITRRQGGKLMFYNFSHSFDALVPVDKWFDSHPEYFSMCGGARLKERTQLCLSNPDVLKLCIEGVRRWIKDNPECKIFSVSMNDWYNPCECPECKAIDKYEGSHAGSVIRFVNAIADDIARDYPDVMIHTFAYLYCRRPPKHVRPRSNVIVRLCSIECCFSHPIGKCGKERGGIDVQNGSAQNFSDSELADSSSFIDDMLDWSKICENLFIWDYTTNYANYLLPFPNFGVLQANLQLFHKNGIKGVFEQGNFSHGQCSALGQLKTYMLGKLLWNPEQDTNELIEDFVNGYYGKAAKPMLEYVRLWQNAAGEHHAGIYDMPDADYLTDELLEKANALINEALELSADSDEYIRVERESLSVRYALLTREAPTAQGHCKAVEAFMMDAKRLGITELFERKDFEASAEVLKHRQFTNNRTDVPSISYPI